MRPRPIPRKTGNPFDLLIPVSGVRFNEAAADTAENGRTRSRIRLPAIRFNEAAADTAENGA